MALWEWIAIGAVALIGVSLTLGLAIARILGRISDEVSELLDQEPWASAPLARAVEADEQTPRPVVVDSPTARRASSSPRH